jgi:TolA-binding protein
MRYTSYITLATLTGTMLLIPATAPAADKDMLSLQRDVADVEGKIEEIQKTLDSKLSAIQGLAQQALDTANKTSSSINGINSGVTQTLQSEMKGVREQLNSVTALSVKVDSISNDVSDLHNSVASLVTAVNKEQQQLSDLVNQVKLLSVPAAPPPGADAGSAAPGTAAAPQPSAQTLFENGVRDQNSGNLDLALSEYTEFLRLYPNDPSAIRAHYNMGNIYYAKPAKLADAVANFDAAIEQYDVDQVTTPSAYFMKGMALKKQGKRADAITAFEYVTKNFRSAPEASQARSELSTLGVTPTAARKK